MQMATIKKKKKKKRCIRVVQQTMVLYTPRYIRLKREEKNDILLSLSSKARTT
jgi:hypothetical protein